MKSFDIDGNNRFSDAELEAVTSIYSGGYSSVKYEHDTAVYESRYHIASLKGIEYFTRLQALDCSFNELTTLDVSKLPSLVYLNCAGNNISSLNLSNNPALKVLWAVRIN